MRNLTHHLAQRRYAAALVAGTLALGSLTLGARAEAAPTSEGLECLTDAHNTFSLTARDGYVSTPDGNSIYMWGYGPSSGSFQLPGPVLCVTAGTHVRVILHNTLVEPTSIVFPGQSGVTADGKPAQPQLTDTGSMTSLTQSADATGGSVTYEFTAGSPGTYLYESGTDVAKQVQMGLYGALVVRPAGHPAQANDRSDSAFDPDHEYVFLLSEVDPDLHLGVERGDPVDVAHSTARYFMINGRSMPDTLAPNHASWLPNQPYGAMVHIKPYDAQTNPHPALIRYLNAGSVNYPFHPHGSDERVVTQDGSALAGSGGQDLSYLKYDLDVEPGQSLDALMDWRDVEQWDPATNPIPTQLPAIQDQLLVGPDTWFSESGYLGKKGSLPTNITANNECGEYYHVAHSHALQQATNYGATFGGMMTVFRIDPPAGCPTS
ncbi:multicopper oxidase domain-containing protein [Nocardioides sp. CER19]|uniref:multicopper oxidase domain-containing protein n=1 Tax=Nocardioides sp. CER19 TaxID=3038538 RepID=UPI00244835C4|nr:multicopper oxidase domain-containing protein [Nocardioides sp. CER19]MDH2413972.1 multicopper oxidase domain-containing protein [Nocardioides sp. CER19]